MSEQPDKNAQYKVDHIQDFAVVCRRAGVGVGDAKPEDYVRLDARAPDGQTAMASEAVLAHCKETGFEPQFVTNPGLTSEEELIAQRNGRL